MTDPDGMVRIRNGDVVSTKSLNVVWGADGKNTASFKAMKGLQFVLLLLGTEEVGGGEKLDPEAALNKLGWYRQEPR